MNHMIEKEKEFALVRKFIDGDEQAFNELVRLYQTKIYAHARRMLGNHMDADEVTQEVIIVLYNKLDTFQFNASLSTWIYKVTSTRCLNAIRKRKVKRFLMLDDDEVGELKYTEDVVADIDNRDKLKQLDNVLLKLPVKQREVFVLRNFEELSYEEISDITGKSVGGLKANYFHALKKVTELMKDG